MRRDLEGLAVGALTDGDITSAKLASLIEETEATIRRAEASAEIARQKALDPIVSPDPRHARVQMEDAAFRSERLRSLLPRLKARYERVAAAEEREQWKRRYEALKVRRDALSAELVRVYPELADRLADLFGRLAPMDVEISNLHHSRPAGVPLHLASVELEARGLTSFSTTNPSIARDLRLPAWENGAAALWPPPEVPLAVLAAATAPSTNGATWFEDQRARAAAQRVEAQRVAQYYAQEQREREDRESGPRLR